MKKYLSLIIMFTGLLMWNCGGNPPEPPTPEPPPVIPEDTIPVNPNEVIYDETGCLYTSYNQLVMSGYQGWFSCQGDPSGMGWVHYPKDGQLRPGYIGIDCWPDMSEYEKKYAAPGFNYADGSQAFLFSSIDESTIDLHFKWMKEYGVDGVFVQRFVSQTLGGPAKERVNAVLKYALQAAKKYDRAIAVMYDGHIGSQQDYDRITSDWNEIVEKFKLFDNVENPTFLRHNGKPVFAFWGYGFNSRSFDPVIFDKLCENIRGSEQKKVSIMLGVPYSWRTLSSDCVDDERFHESLKKWVDIISPWAVGRYNNTVSPSTITTNIVSDLQWCKANNKDYVPVAFPGFSWRNLKGGDNQYDAIPREKGDFLWKQAVAAKQAYNQVKPKSQMLYVAMFDELDEATCIFKCETKSNLPLNGSGSFVGYDNEIGSDHYLWLTGQISDMFHGKGGFGTSQPIRK